MEGFADEAENRLGQDLMLLASGHRTRALLGHLKHKDFIGIPAVQNTEFTQKYKERISAALATPVGPSTYVHSEQTADAMPLGRS